MLNPGSGPIRGMGMKLLVSAVFLFLTIGGLYYRVRTERLNRNSPGKEVRETRFYMDTFVEIIIVSPDKKKAREAMNEAFAVFGELERKFSFYNSHNLLQDTNSRSEVPVSDIDLEAVLSRGFEFAGKTGGRFDITLGAVKQLYPIGKENPKPPERRDVEKALSLSGYKKASLKEGKLTKPQGMLIDTGGILKGYGVDRAIEALQKRGIKNVLVNAGGNIRTLGKNGEGEAWRIGVEHPRAPGSKMIAVLELDNRAVATSGDYQRYFFYDGKRYHHIIDPETGEPANRAISATVIAPDAITADALSTAVFVMGRKEGLKFLEDNGLEGIIIDGNGAEATDGLGKEVKIDY